MSSRGYIGIGIAGTAWITRTHAHALQTINQIAPLPREVRLVNVYGRREEAAAQICTLPKSRPGIQVRQASC
jgi:predicted dehydrogenase